MLLASRCVICGAAGPPVCEPCGRRLAPAGPVAPPPGLDELVAVLRFEGAGRDLVLALKYHDRRAVVAPLARAMADAVRSGAGAGARPPELVTWAPTSAARRRERGFDQARLLAAGVGRALGLPVRGLLRRAGGAAQTGLVAAERWRGPEFRPTRGCPAGAEGRRVLLVDDVVTTGATLAAGARALRGAGALGVDGVTAAARSLKVGG